MTPQSSTNGNQKTWQVGEIADETGLSVRTLHHYEEIGLLSPASRGENSYRLYDENDLARLQQIVSLKQLGFSLDEIKQCLASPDFSPEKTMAMHLQQLEEQMKTQEDLKERLDGLLRFLKHQGKAGPEALLEAIKLMNKLEDMWTPEEMEKIKLQGKKIGKEAIVSAEQEWPQLMAAAKAHMEKGTDPKSPEMQKIAKRWQELVNAFTGGDPKIAAKLKKMYEENPDARQKFAGPGFDPQLMAYVGEAMKGL